MDYAAELSFAKALAHEAGSIMLRYFRSADQSVQIKADKTIVTLADTEINSLLISRSQQQFPAYNVLGEEESFTVANAQLTWVCDPVDGTAPFAKGLPISTFSLALVDGDGRAVLGVAYDPYQDRLYEAVRAKGAYLNGRRIAVSGHANLDGAFIDQELWVNHQEGVSFDDPKDSFNKQGAKITTLCSAIITRCLVAEGQYEAMIFGQSKPEDIAALSVIVEEAGGKVTDLKGSDQRYDQKIYGAVVSNGRVHDQIVAALKDINYLNPARS